MREQLRIKFRDGSFRVSDLRPGDMRDGDVAREVNRLAMAAYARATGKQPTGIVYLRTQPLSPAPHHARTRDDLPDGLSFEEIRNGGAKIETVATYPAGYTASVRSDGGLTVTDETGAVVGTFPAKHWITRGSDVFSVCRFAKDATEEPFATRNWSGNGAAIGLTDALRGHHAGETRDESTPGATDWNGSGCPRALSAALKSKNRQGERT